MAGKHKGNSFERDVCRILSGWWTKGERDDLFWRSSNSGGRATVRGKAGKKANLHCGDVCAIDSVGEPLLQAFVIELKKGYNETTIHNLIDGKKESELLEWFEKAEVDRQRAGALYWVVIHRRDYRDALLFAPCGLIWKLELIGEFQNNLDNVIINVGSHEVYAFRLDDFLNQVEPNAIPKLLEKAKADKEQRSPEDLPEDSPREFSDDREIA